MEDMNWKTWALIFIIAMGAGLEFLKRMPGAGEGVDLEKLGLHTGGTPYNVKMKDAPMVFGTPNNRLPKPTARPFAVAGQALRNENMDPSAAPVEKTDFDHVLKTMAAKNAAEAKKKKDKDGEEYEIIVDPKTGKRYKRKKKKGAKLEVKKEEVVAAKEEPKKEEKRDEDRNVEDLMHDVMANGQLPPAPAAPDSPFADLEEWKRRLLTRPDTAETRRFIEHYQKSIVTADIFYKITTMMIEDSRAEMKELGILCAGSTPSVMSFTLLAEIFKTERSGSNPRRFAETFLDAYANPQNLTTLQNILRSPSSNSVAILAAKKLDKAATTLLAPSKNKQTAGATATSTARHSNAGYFTAFVSILTTLGKNPDASVAEQAKSSLTALQALMNPHSATPVSPATAPTQVQASVDRY